VDRREGGGFVDYEWLESQPAVEETTYLRHIELEQSLEVWVDGRSRKGLVLREDLFV